jgi:acyl-CoA reductase-like NAD-dependent aldehyde dehydrogenase
MPRKVVCLSTVTRTAKELTVPYSSVNPATGEVLKTFTEHTDQEMMDALATADKAFVSWAARPVEERAKIISRAAQLLLERKSELAKLATLEMGSLLSDARLALEAFIDAIPEATSRMEPATPYIERKLPAPPNSPLTAMEAFAALSELRPKDAILVQETPSNGADLLQCWPTLQPDS